MAERVIRTGVDMITGRILRGRAHAEQSVLVILSIHIDTLVMLLDFGSDLRALRGENMTAVNVLKAYAEIVRAIHAWEPNVRIRKIEPMFLQGRAGAIGFALAYLHYPYGHLGDYSVVETADMRVPVTALARGLAA